MSGLAGTTSTHLKPYTNIHAHAHTQRYGAKFACTLQARAELEAHNREVELAGLRQEVQEADAKLEAAVAHAQASLNATWQAEMERAQVVWSSFPLVIACA
eukprot:443484-Pelagomonas_calceolata.AAC.6